MTSLDISIKKIEEETELIDVVPLKQSNDALYGRGTRQSESEALDKLETLYEEGHDIWLAKQNGTPVGYTIGNQFFEKYELEETFVHEDYQNKGIGTKLKENQIIFARKEGCESIEGFVAKGDEAGKTMLEKADFTVKEHPNGYVAEIQLQKE